jgi:hypothetical protein
MDVESLEEQEEDFGGGLILIGGMCELLEEAVRQLLLLFPSLRNHPSTVLLQ